MFLILSGEGASDIGVSNLEIGPMTKLVDASITNQIGYSLIETKLFTIFSEQDLAKKAKEIKPRSKKGKRQPSETRYFYKNARALALLAHQKAQELGEDIPLVVVLFRDADGTASSGRGEWADKWRSILDGFEAEGITTGVPMLPKPISEAWILCALGNNYQRCAKLENESGNPHSPKPLKKQLADHLGQPGSREVLNDKIDDGAIDLDKITDMPSITAFKERLHEVLTGIIPALGHEK
jgi:hypothetical protein